MACWAEGEFLSGAVVDVGVVKLASTLLELDRIVRQASNDDVLKDDCADAYDTVVTFIESGKVARVIESSGREQLPILVEALHLEFGLSFGIELIHATDVDA